MVGLGAGSSQTSHHWELGVCFSCAVIPVQQGRKKCYDRIVKTAPILNYFSDLMKNKTFP